jgi:hypothetical protein
VGVVAYAELSARTMFTAFGARAATTSAAAGDCGHAAATTLWILADDSGAGSAYAAQKQQALKYDGVPPAAPIANGASSGDSDVVVGFAFDSKASPDLDGFQVLWRDLPRSSASTVRALTPC